MDGHFHNGSYYELAVKIIDDRFIHWQKCVSKWNLILENEKAWGPWLHSHWNQPTYYMHCPARLRTLKHEQTMAVDLRRMGRIDKSENTTNIYKPGQNSNESQILMSLLAHVLPSCGVGRPGGEPGGMDRLGGDHLHGAARCPQPPGSCAWPLAIIWW